MKKRVVVSIAILITLTVLGGIVLMLLNSKEPPNLTSSEVEKFELTNYQWEIENFSSDNNVGSVDDANTAIEKAKELWVEKFSVIGGQSYNPINGKPIKVYFDKNNDCWHVHGTLPKNMVGGVPHALIQTDGNVIAVWFDD